VTGNDAQTGPNGHGPAPDQVADHPEDRAADQVGSRPEPALALKDAADSADLYPVKNNLSRRVRIALGVVFFPVGLAWLLWRTPRLTTKTKVVITAAAVAVLAITGAVSPDESSRRDSALAGSIADRGSGEPSTTAKPTTASTAKPATTTTTASPERELQARVSKALGASNRKHSPRVTVSFPTPGERVILTWAINENLTEGLTKDTARLEAIKILQAIDKLGVDYSGAVLEGTYPLVDKLGNAAEETVVRASYDRATIDRINFENFLFKHVFDPDVASSAAIHPAFQY
jgi:hypothetical protein